ncbi:MAG: porin family protein [Gemmatimonadaceae bacterium]
MKRFYILAFGSALCLSVPAGLRAQVPAAHPSFGVLGALNLSTFGGSGTTGMENKVGYTAGGFVRIPVSPAWSFQPELDYTTKGVKFTFDSNLGTYVSTQTLPYVEMPLLLRVDGNSAGGIGLFAEFGPALAARVGCSTSLRGGGQSLSGPCAGFSQMRTFDVGAMAGGGIDLPLLGHMMTLGVRYNYGLSAIAGGSSVKNRNLQFLAGWRP